MNEQKRKYRVTNWRAYNAALVARGSLTVWFDEAAVAGWYETERTGRRGAPRRYAEVAVQCGLVVREVFHLPLRALTGFWGSLAGVARELGLVEQTLRNWVKVAAAGKLEGAGGKAVTPEEMELSRLRAENLRLKRELEIIKKAAAYFAKDAL